MATVNLTAMKSLIKRVKAFFVKEWFLFVMLVAIGLIVLLFEWLL